MFFFHKMHILSKIKQKIMSKCKRNKIQQILKDGYLHAYNGMESIC